MLGKKVVMVVEFNSFSMVNDLDPLSLARHGHGQNCLEVVVKEVLVSRSKEKVWVVEIRLNTAI
jgi:hypothetical protein